MKALILLDIQNDFLPGGALAVTDGDKIIPIINQISPAFDLVIATQDWHPPGHMSFASSHPGKKAFESINIDGMDQILWPDHCVQETFGADFPKGLDTHKVEAIIRKGTESNIDSYSAFFDNAHRKNTGLSGYLKARSVTEIYFCGLTADVCVYYSILDAISEGFSCVLFKDATAALNENNFQKIKKELLEKKVKILSCTGGEDGTTIFCP
jgi:nicotinamidase/pyrazinamidase